MTEKKRTPYVKLYSDLTGELLNPITKDKPYIHPFQFPKKKNSKNNKKGCRIVIINYGKGLIVKYNVVEQTINCPCGKTKTIFHYVEKKRVNKNINKLKTV